MGNSTFEFVLTCLRCVACVCEKSGVVLYILVSGYCGVSFVGVLNDRFPSFSFSFRFCYLSIRKSVEGFIQTMVDILDDYCFAKLLGLTCNISIFARYVLPTIQALTPSLSANG